MIKKLLITLIFFFVPMANAESLYVSPESYAVNEADLTDYRYIPPSPKLNIDTLESMRFLKEEEKQEPIKQVSEKKQTVKKERVKKEKAEKPFEKRLSYKVAKWWVDQRYKREEEHHGEKHEIKVKARMEKEANDNNI